MAEGDALTQNAAKKHLLDLLAARTLKVVLCSGDRPVVDGTVVLGDLTQIVASNYTAGGKALSNKVVTQDDVNNRATLDADDVLWSQLGAPSAPMTYAAIYDDDHASDLVLGTWAIVKQSNGGNYTLEVNAVGLFMQS